MTNGILAKKKAELYRVVDIGNQYGNMNTAAKFYEEGMSLEERRLDFLKRRIQLGNDLGFDGRKMFMADQQTKDGSYRIIDKDLVESVEDGWSVDTKEDILIITTDTPEVVIGHPVADCPVVMLRDVKKGVTAIGHCSAEMINIGLPELIADAMLDSYGCNEEDIIAYVSACASKESYIYDNYPNFAKNEYVWNGSIIEKEKKFYIDLRNAIRKQFEERNISKYVFNLKDTITDDSFYSNSAAYHGKSEKDGRNFAGAYYVKKR